MTRGRILVVDDEPAMAQLLYDHLTEHDYQVTAVHSGIQSLVKLAQQPYDIVLLDVRMPEMDGIEVLKRIRENYPRIGVLMISANDDVELAKETIALGAFDYAMKPLDFEYLTRALDKMLAAQVTGEAADAPAEDEAAPLQPSSYGLLYDLALAVFRATRGFSAVAREHLGRELESVALTAMRMSVSGEKVEVIRSLNQLRTLLRFARDLGDLPEDDHRLLDGAVAKARRAAGLS